MKSSKTPLIILLLSISFNFLSLNQTIASEPRAPKAVSSNVSGLTLAPTPKICLNYIPDCAGLSCAACRSLHPNACTLSCDNPNVWSDEPTDKIVVYKDKYSLMSDYTNYPSDLFKHSPSHIVVSDLGYGNDVLTHRIWIKNVDHKMKTVRVIVAQDKLGSGCDTGIAVHDRAPKFFALQQPGYKVLIHEHLRIRNC